jgi:hypothetical protein
LLPFLEASGVYNRFDADALRQDVERNPSVTYRGYWTYFPNTWRMAFATIPSFLCASNPFVDPVWSVDSAVTIEDGGLAQYDPFGGRTEDGAGQSHYMGISGAFGEAPGGEERIGIFLIRHRHSLRHVKDGTSNTLMFGENNGGWLEDGRYLGVMWIGVGTMPVMNGLVTGAGPGVALDQFSSAHPGVVQFVRADGSVLPVVVDIDQNILNNLAGVRDGMVTNHVF